MSNSIRLRWGLLWIAGLGTLVSPAWAGEVVGAPATYEYFYFDQPVIMQLDATRIAVFDDRPGADPAGQRELLATGIAPEQIKPHAAPNWWIAATPAATRDATAVEELVRNVAASTEANFVSPVMLDDRGNPLIMTHDILLRFKPSVSNADAERLLASLDFGTVVERNIGGDSLRYRLRSHAADGFVVLDQANTLATLPEILYAEPNKLITGSVFPVYPTDPYFQSNDLWGLHNIGQGGCTADKDMNGPQAWDICQGDPDVRVGIFDLGVQQDHPDLNQDPGYDYTGSGTGGGPYNGCDNHGTSVAGCVSAIMNNGIGVVGIAPQCKSVSFKVGIADSPCSNLFTAEDNWLTSALYGAQGLNISVTNSSFRWGLSAAITDAYQSTYSTGIMHVASSGNTADEGEIPVEYPAYLPEVIAVGAVTCNGSRASFSCYGDALDVVAPGVAIWTTDRTGLAGDNPWGDYVETQGTSFSSPYVAGVVALMRAHYPDMSQECIRDLLEQSCKNLYTAGWDQYTGWGLVDAYAALQYEKPGVFILISPQDGMSGVSTGPTLSWTVAANRDSYTVTIDTAPDFSSQNAKVYAELTGQSLVLEEGTLNQETTYYWKVEAFNCVGMRSSNPISRSFTTFRDCNGNGIDDGVDLAECDGSPWCDDCNGNGRPDICDLEPHVEATSLSLSPLGSGYVQTFTLVNPPVADGDVTLTFNAKGDIRYSSEYVTVDVNGLYPHTIYVGTYYACEAGQVDAFTMPAADYNTAKAGGDVHINMTPSAAVHPLACSGDNYIQVSIAYDGVPISSDDNGNGIPDECEGPELCAGDMNCDGVVDYADIDPFVSALSCVGGAPGCWDPSCPWLNGDCDGDDNVTYADIDAFVARIGATCP